MDFIDLKSQQKRLQPGLDAAIAKVLAHGQYVLGPEVTELETQLANYVGTRFAMGCANGTDALILAMKAFEIGPGDAVLCPSFTYSATAEAIALIGATPVFVDIDPRTYNMCAESFERTLKDTIAKSVSHPRAVITVDLFGQSADYRALAPIARKYDVKIIADAAQAFGTQLDGQAPSHWADIMTTSFFPAKPLGCYGDGGAIMTNDSTLADMMDSLHNHGKGTDKYDNVRIGLNSRLDSIQAAVLLEKLKIFNDEIEARNVIAQRYIRRLDDRITTPFVPENTLSTWAQFTIEVDQPDNLALALREQDIPTARYYPRPTHMQTAYIHYPLDPAGLKNTEACMTRVISLPMHAYLELQTQDRIIRTIEATLR